MDGHIALRCPTQQAAENAALCLTEDRQLLSPRALAVVWVNRRSQYFVRHGCRPRNRWAWWLMMSAAIPYGGHPGLAQAQPQDVPLPARVCDEIIRLVAHRLGPGEAAVVVTLGDPTPLLLVEAVRQHVCGVVWSTLSHGDEELMAAFLVKAPAD